MITVTNTAKVNKYARKGSVVVKKFMAHFHTIKLSFLLKSYHSEILESFVVFITGGKGANLRQSFKCCVKSSPLHSCTPIGGIYRKSLFITSLTTTTPVVH